MRQPSNTSTAALLRPAPIFEGFSHFLKWLLKIIGPRLLLVFGVFYFMLPAGPSFAQQNCKWFGTKPFCSGSCPRGWRQKRTRRCTTGRQVYCCNPNAPVQNLNSFVIPCPCIRSPIRFPPGVSKEWTTSFNTMGLGCGRAVIDNSRRRVIGPLICHYASGNIIYVHRRIPPGYPNCNAQGQRFVCNRAGGALYVRLQFEIRPSFQLKVWMTTYGPWTINDQGRPLLWNNALSPREQYLQVPASAPSNRIRITFAPQLSVQPSKDQCQRQIQARGTTRLPVQHLPNAWLCFQLWSGRIARIWISQVSGRPGQPRSIRGRIEFFQ